MQEVFREYYRLLPEKPPLKFAEPGAERQDSVYNGFQVMCFMCNTYCDCRSANCQQSASIHNIAHRCQHIVVDSVLLHYSSVALV